MVLSATSGLAQLGLQTISLGVSLGEGLEVPYKYYENKVFHMDETFSAHFYMSFKGQLKLIKPNGASSTNMEGTESVGGVAEASDGATSSTASSSSCEEGAEPSTAAVMASNSYTWSKNTGEDQVYSVINKVVVITGN